MQENPIFLRDIDIQMKIGGNHVFFKKALKDKTMCEFFFFQIEVLKGSRDRAYSGESTRLPLMWLGFDSRTRRHMWVEFIVGSRPSSERFFSGYSGFPLFSKINISKFHVDQKIVPIM